MKPGDWICGGCQCHNFASRTNCFRCSAPNVADDGRYAVDGSGGMSGYNQYIPRQRPGEWVCPKPTCKFQNFASRYECMRCNSRRNNGDMNYPMMGKPMSGNIPPPISGGISSRVLPGDWFCANCNINNFASRTRCLQCGVPNTRDSRSIERHGDWSCPNDNCRYHNFASRSECYRCGTRKAVGQWVNSSNRGYNAGEGTERSDVGGSSSDFNRNSDVPYSYPLKINPGDWICTERNCGFYNFSGREVCSQCGTPARIAEGPPGVSPESMNAALPL